MAEGNLTAAAMYRAVQLDPQFTAPRRPALCRGLVSFPVSGGIVFEGGPARQILRGRAATNLLPRLLPLLDGSADTAAIAAATGDDVHQVDQAVALMYSCGLLEEGEGRELDADPALQWWSRSLDSTRVFANGETVRARLRSRPVVVTGDPAAGEPIGAALAALGVPVRRDLLDPVRDGEPPVGSPPAAVIGVGFGAAPELVRIAAECERRHVGFFPIRIAGPVADIGPWIDRDYAPAYRDVERQRAALPPADGARPIDPATLEVLLSVISLHLANLLARIGAVPALRFLLRFDAESWSQQSVVVSGIPDDVPPAAATTTAGAPLVSLFEASVAFPPRDFVDPKSHQMHYKPSNLGLQHDAKRWPSARSVPMPAEPAAPSATFADAPAGDLTAGALAALVRRVAGRRGAADDLKVQRYAPTGGNLGSVQAYLAVVGVAGLADGIWGYDVAGERLSVVADGRAAGELTGTIDDFGPRAVVVLTAALARVASKYLGFALRVIHLDAGVAVYQARVAGAALGLTVVPGLRWDDARIGTMLRIAIPVEPITAVLQVAGRPTDPDRQVQP